MHGTNFHCVEVVFATSTATSLTKWVERLREEGFFSFLFSTLTQINVDHLMRADRAEALGEKVELRGLLQRIFTILSSWFVT